MILDLEFDGVEQKGGKWVVIYHTLPFLTDFTVPYAQLKPLK